MWPVTWPVDWRGDGGRTCGHTDASRTWMAEYPCTRRIECHGVMCHVTHYTYSRMIDRCKLLSTKGLSEGGQPPSPISRLHRHRIYMHNTYSESRMNSTSIMRDVGSCTARIQTILCGFVRTPIVTTIAVELTSHNRPTAHLAMMQCLTKTNGIAPPSAVMG